jgi:hypothetical protein
MSSSTNRAFVRSLTLVPAVLLVHLGTAAAADFMQHQRELLSGRPPTVSTPLNTQRSPRQTSPAGDAQTLARQLLLGGKTPGEPQPGLTNSSRYSAYGDAQVLAQHLLGGGRAALAAGS